MATYRRYNELTREYEPWEVPDDWHLLCYSSDMDEKCNCAMCGKELRYGDTYTSFQIHTKNGFGYGVCESCHFQIEAPLREEARK